MTLGHESREECERIMNKLTEKGLSDIQSASPNEE